MAIKLRSIGILIGISLMSITTVFGQGYNVTKQPYSIGNKQLVLDSIVHNGKTYTELRAAGEYLGVDVDFGDDIITLRTNSAEELKINTLTNKAYIFNPLLVDEEYATQIDDGIDVIIINGKSYVQLRPITDALGYDIGYKEGKVMVENITSTVMEREAIYSVMGIFEEKYKYTAGSEWDRQSLFREELRYFATYEFMVDGDFHPDHDLKEKELLDIKNRIIENRANLINEQGSLTTNAEGFYNSIINHLSHLITLYSLDYSDHKYESDKKLIDMAVQSYNNFYEYSSKIYTGRSLVFGIHPVNYDTIYENRYNYLVMMGYIQD